MTTRSPAALLAEEVAEAGLDAAPVALCAMLVREKEAITKKEQTATSTTRTTLGKWLAFRPGRKSAQQLSSEKKAKFPGTE